MKPLETSVRNQISLFVEGFLTADRFNELLPDTVALDESGEPVAIGLVMLAIGYLAEYQAGLRMEEDVREALAQEASWSVERGSYSAVVTLQAGLEAQARADVGTPLQVVYA